MADTPNVKAPIWAASEASPWLASGKRARIFDAFSTSVIVEAMDQTAPPGSCADGSRYLIAAPATGAWAGHNGELAIAVGANASNGWYFATVAVDGMLLHNRADDRNYRYSGGVWNPFADAVSRFQDLFDVTLAGLADGYLFVWDASNGSLYPVDPSTALGGALSGYVQATLDTDASLAANSDTHVATQKAVKAYVDALAAVIGATRLQDLHDVDVTGLADGFVLKWDASNGVFYFAPDNSSTGSGTVTESFVIALSDETTAITAGTNKTRFRMPYPFTITEVRASLSTAQSTGSVVTVDINESGSTILSTKLTIDNTESTSKTAATAAVISDAVIADDAELTFDIDQVGDGTAKGLKVTIIGHQ